AFDQPIDEDAVVGCASADIDAIVLNRGACPDVGIRAGRGAVEKVRVDAAPGGTGAPRTDDAVVFNREIGRRAQTRRQTAANQDVAFIRACPLDREAIDGDRVLQAEVYRTVDGAFVGRVGAGIVPTSTVGIHARLRTAQSNALVDIDIARVGARFDVDNSIRGGRRGVNAALDGRIRIG